MYVVTGVTGNTGSLVATTLLAAKQPVRVVVRDAAKGAAWKARGAEVVVADVGDRAALSAALTGATGAYVLLPPPAWGQSGLAADRAAKIAAIAGAVSDARPGHVVALSSIGAQHAAGTGPIADLHRLEAALTATGVPATFLRAAYFMENWGAMLQGAIDGGTLYHGSRAGLAFPQVATTDIGRTAARLLVEGKPAAGTRVVDLAGPVDASTQDVAAVLSKIAGKPIAAVSIPTSAVAQSLVGMGASQELANGLAELVDGLNAGLLTWTTAAPVRGSVTIEQRLRELLGK